MICRLLSLFFLSFLTAAQLQAADEKQAYVKAKQVVQELQTLPHHIFFCQSDTWDRRDDDVINRIDTTLRPYFSKEFRALFLWVKCGEPNTFWLVTNDRRYYFDFRFGLSETDSNYDRPLQVTNVQVLSPVVSNKGSVSVTVLYNWRYPQAFSTKYTLIQEAGAWKIDDIALHGYETSMEEILPSIKSLKAEMQNSYRRAEANFRNTKSRKP